MVRQRRKRPAPVAIQPLAYADAQGHVRLCQRTLPEPVPTWEQLKARVAILERSFRK